MSTKRVLTISQRNKECYHKAKSRLLYRSTPLSLAIITFLLCFTHWWDTAALPNSVHRFISIMGRSQWLTDLCRHCILWNKVGSGRVYGVSQVRSNAAIIEILDGSWVYKRKFVNFFTKRRTPKTRKLLIEARKEIFPGFKSASF